MGNNRPYGFASLRAFYSHIYVLEMFDIETGSIRTFLFHSLVTLQPLTGLSSWFVRLFFTALDDREDGFIKYDQINNSTTITFFCPGVRFSDKLLHWWGRQLKGFSMDTVVCVCVCLWTWHRALGWHNRVIFQIGQVWC